MRRWRNDIIVEAKEFAARWGFLTRDLFFEFMCPMSRAHKFRYWSALTSSGHFRISRASQAVLILTPKGRAMFNETARPARQAIYVAHDSVAARVVLALKKRDLISKYWLEDELMRNPIDAYTILGAERIPRIPDVIFDLRTRDGFVRCSLEVERTVKSQSRYAKIALAYLGYSKVSLMLFACDSDATEAAVRRSFGGKVFTDKKRVPGLFNYTGFDPDSLNTNVRFNDQEMTFKNLLAVLSQFDIKPMNFSRDDKETAVSLKISEKSEAA